jgi:antitoxin PrlF
MTDKVTLGRRGVMTLPAKVRKRYGLQESDELLVEETAAGILLRPVVSMPVELYTEERVREFERDDAAIGKMLDELGIP